MIENIGLIVDDNPISRSYINILKNKKIKLKYVIYLLGPNFFFEKFFAKINYLKKNSYAINFLKDPAIINLFNQFESYFNFEKNFCLQMYNFDNIFDISEKVIFSSDVNINSLKVINILNQIPKTIFFNTGKQILKKILNTRHQFIHIHPGYLPNIKGADGSLWQIRKLKSIGVSSFFMSEGIDDGKIIYRETLKMPNFYLQNFNKYKIKDIYRIWFSFFDPLLRAYQFNKLAIENFDFSKFNTQIKESEEIEYFSFMKKNDLKMVFDEVFKNNY